MATHPRTILIAWVAAIALGAWGEHQLPNVVVGGVAGVPGSPSHAANEALRKDFDNPFIDPLIVAVSAPGLSVDREPYLGWIERASQQLARLPEVRRVENYAATRDPQLRSADGHVTMLIVGLAARAEAGQQHAVVVVRNAVAPLRAALLRLDPRARVAVTGGPAADYDVNAWSASGGDHAEKSALPLTLLILLVAFGTVVAAGLPFLMGLATTTLALGAAFVLAKFVPVSNLLSNVVTMVGLAIGIDYSLLMVTRFRENQPNESVAERVADTVARAGQTITWSGVTVMIGFLGLLFSPILETRCAGIGGAMVVCVSVLAALTLLPAALVLLGPYLERWSVIPRRMRLGNTTALWHWLGAWVIKHPIKTLIVSGACILALGLPILRATTGVSNERWFLPLATESRQGADILARIRDDNAQLTTYAIVRATDGLPILAPAHLAPLIEYAQRIERDPRVASVASPVTLQPGFGAREYAAFYANLDQALEAHPQIAELYLSRDRGAALFAITPVGTLPVKQIEALARDLEKIVPVGPFKVAIGGDPAEHVDFNHYMFRSLPKIFGFVVGATLIMLFFAFRSYLLPLEAVLMNLLAVSAGIGAVVGVFQYGWLNGLIGLERPFEAIPLEVPMMVFCLSFGLSMDYELFLLFRIKREYAIDQNNDRATVAGMVAVAPVITGAGLIMAAVFGAFVGAQLPVLKMMGVGLCVAVLVDATVIRTFVVPAVTALGGRFNWYPGVRPRK
ncbi:MAG TPA: MMPL family transporter [Steroidobacteraceae bacterium]|nr:MMPL family transporter [Steroidobacteraceae bacterium]